MTSMRRWILIAACLTLWPALAAAQTTWETHRSGGAEAYRRGDYAEAERQFLSAVREAEAFGTGDGRLAMTLADLANLYQAEAKYGQAERLDARALAIAEAALGPEHAEVGRVLNKRGLLAYAQGRYEDAERLYQRSLGILERVLGRAHPDVASNLNNQALLYHVQRRYAEAERLYQRALAIAERSGNPEAPDLATTLNNLGELCREQGKYGEAERLCERALAEFRGPASRRQRDAQQLGAALSRSTAVRPGGATLRAVAGRRGEDAGVRPPGRGDDPGELRRAPQGVEAAGRGASDEGPRPRHPGQARPGKRGQLRRCCSGSVSGW